MFFSEIIIKKDIITLLFTSLEVNSDFHSISQRGSDSWHLQKKQEEFLSE